MISIFAFDIIGLTISVVFFLIFLLRTQQSRYSRYVIMAGMLISAILILQSTLIALNLQSFYKILFFFTIPLQFTIYPVVYLYLSALISAPHSVKTQPSHFLLSFLVFVSLAALFVVLDAEQYVQSITQTYMFSVSESSWINAYVFSLYALYYLQAAFFFFRFFKLRRQMESMSNSAFKADWIKYVIITLAVYELSFFIALLLNDGLMLLDVIISDLIILAMGIIGLKHDDLLIELQIANSMGENELISTERKIQSSLPPEIALTVMSELEQSIKDGELFLNPGIRLKNFAHKLHIPEKELSILINESHGMNFPRFINQFRIEKACELLENSNVKISELPIQVGFFSRSAFNTAFKETTGKSPSEFRESLQPN